MKNEILTLMEYLEKERGLDKGTVANVLEESMEKVARKKEHMPPVQVHIDIATGEIVIGSEFTIIPDDYEFSSDEEADEIGPCVRLSEAREMPLLKDTELEPWTTLSLPPFDRDELFGRIDVQTIRQITTQSLQEAQRDTIMREYSSRKGSLVSGTIIRIHKGDFIVQLDRTEALLPRRGEQSPLEHYKVGDTIRAIVKDVREGDVAKGRDPRVILSRACPAMVKALLELEVPEIYEHDVEVVDVVRSAGFRTKVSVRSRDSRIDPVGACVGSRGTRIHNIKHELGGENVDIIRYDDDLETFIRDAVKPVEIEEYVQTGAESNPFIVVIVADEDLREVLGRGGENIRLISELVARRLPAPPEEEAPDFERRDFKINVLSRSKAEEIRNNARVEAAPAEDEEEAPEAPETQEGKDAIEE